MKQIGTFQQGDVIHIPIDDLDQKYKMLPQDKKIVIVDVMGKQEEIAGRFLTLKGYKNLAVMAGGGRAWFKMLRVNVKTGNESAQAEVEKKSAACGYPHQGWAPCRFIVFCACRFFEPAGAFFCICQNYGGQHGHNHIEADVGTASADREFAAEARSCFITVICQSSLLPY